MERLGGELVKFRARRIGKTYPTLSEAILELLTEPDESPADRMKSEIIARAAQHARLTDEELSEIFDIEVVNA